jgi:hypothetical protein
MRRMQSTADPAPSTRAPSEYEFGEAENVVIGSCGGRAQIWGILCVVAGAVQIVASILNIVHLIQGNGWIFMLPAGVFNCVMGVYFTRAGAALKSVVATQGNDITLMMNALRNMARALLVQIIATAVFIMLVLAIIAVMVVALRMLGKA